jgi:hypothetical protein
MNEDMSDLPPAIAADPDGVQVALRAAHTLWSRGDTVESLKWLRKAAESASDEGADIRSLQLAKAAAELRAKLLGGSEPPARQGFAGSFSATAGSAAPHQGSGAFPPSDVGPGESGSHPIAQPRARPESEPPHASSSSAPPIEAFVAGAAQEESAGAMSSRPVTATQYPSHRPRQRMGLLSASPASTRDGAAYASVPSWSADSERRGSGAPPPLPGASLDDYEELEAEPDDEPADDPGSVWSSAGPESWHPADASAEAYAAPQGAASGNAAPGATPPPLPPRGAFSDDDTDFTQQTEAQTVVIPPLEENGDAEPRSSRDVRRAGDDFGVQGFAVQGNAWDQQSRMPSWDRDTGSSWAAELHQSALHQSPWGGPSADDGANQEGLASEAAPQSETARAKLTARVHHQAVRVSFAPDQRVPGQYVVRPLREGEKAATGERVALLVALEPGMPLV